MRIRNFYQRQLYAIIKYSARILMIKKTAFHKIQMWYARTNANNNVHIHIEITETYLTQAQTAPN